MSSFVSVKELIDNGIQEVPPMFIRPPEDRPFVDGFLDNGASPDEDYNGTCQRQLMSDEEIPVIDVSDLIRLTTDASHQPSGRVKVLERIGRACEDYGFFQVINHGVESDAIRNIRKAALHFFDQPPQERRRIGGTFYKGGFNSQFATSPQDWVEGLIFKRLPPCGSDTNDFKIAPDNLPIRGAPLLEYFDRVERLANIIYGAIFDSLGLKSDCEMVVPKLSFGALGIHYYPPCPNPSVVMGFSPHSDLASITILHQDDVPGLQVRKNKKWILVKSCHPNALIVNVADQIEILTNGMYKSIEHRVFTNFKQARMSIACFFGPAYDTTIAPIPGLIDQKNPPRFKPTLFGDYYKNFFSKALQANKGGLDFAKA